MNKLSVAEFGGLAADWADFELLEFPPSFEGRRFEGEAAEAIDAVAAGCVSTFLAAGTLDAECRQLLDTACRRLGLAAEAAAQDDDGTRDYFVRFHALAGRVLAAL